MLLQLAAVSACLATMAYAEEASIGVYLDEAGTICTGQTAGGMLRGSIWVNIAGAAAGGITSAEFRVDNDDRSGYSMVVEPDPAATGVVGNPFGTGPFNQGGTNIGYASCQTGPRLRLFTFTALEVVPSTDVWLTVRPHYTASNPYFVCPLVTLCDYPAFTKVCVAPPRLEGEPESDHWRSVINPSAGVTSDCVPVGVAPVTWSHIKAFYRG
jgi:hypothetical protein